MSTLKRGHPNPGRHDFFQLYFGYAEIFEEIRTPGATAQCLDLGEPDMYRRLFIRAPDFTATPCRRLAAD